MHRILVPLSVGLLLCTTSCKKDDGTMASSGVSITFRTDSGYTSISDTVPQHDTLRIGATITEGSDPLQHFYLSVAYDDSMAIALDTVSVNVNPFVYVTTHVTRGQAGTEQVIFTVEEPDGDRTTRRLTFWVP